MLWLVNPWVRAFLGAFLLLLETVGFLGMGLLIQSVCVCIQYNAPLSVTRQHLELRKYLPLDGPTLYTIIIFTKALSIK